MVPFAILGSLALIPATADAGVDRYGGVWHPAEDSGFLLAGMGHEYADIEASIDSPLFDGFTITDFEIRSKGCPWDDDEFDVQWNKGDRVQKLVVYPDILAFANGVAEMCENGYAVEDFEQWGGSCEGRTEYVVLFGESDICPGPDKPFPAIIPIDVTVQFFESAAASHFFMVDIEIDGGGMPDAENTVAVYYAGDRKQKLDFLPRKDFETLIDTDDTYALVDMESWRPPGDAEHWDGRLVFALREESDKVENHLEMGERFSKFSALGVEDKYTLADFEVYQDTNDFRFERGVRAEVTGTGGGWALTVMEEGEVIAEAVDGWARENDPNVPGSGIPMETDTRGCPASVTKLYTTFGAMRYAEQQLDPDAWLDTPITDLLPPDFGNFGENVEMVTMRRLMMQRSGLKVFVPQAYVLTDPDLVRLEMIKWLQEPLADLNQDWEYQNAHFDLIALIMNEVVLPPIVPGSSPWKDWMNEEVFALAGIEPAVCGGEPEDALAYTHAGGSPGHEWVSSSWDCGGFGTGSGMFWLSAAETAALLDAAHSGDVVAPEWLDTIWAQGLGLDGLLWTGNSPLGQSLIYKNGGISTDPGYGTVASEAVAAWMDEFVYDDPPPSPWAGPTDPFEAPVSELSGSIFLHRSRYTSSGTLWSRPEYLLKRGWEMDEDW